MKEKKIKILVVDDSPFARQTISGMVAEAPHMEVIGTAANGLEAIRFIEHALPDIITLDIEMPEMNGFTFLNWLMKNRPLPVLVVSSRTDSQNVFKALDLGALEFIGKPTARASQETQRMKDELINKLEIIAKVSPDRIKSRTPLQTEALSPPPSRKRIESEKGGQDLSRPLNFPKKEGSGRPAIVIIGASTGGPAALQTLISGLPADFPLPVVVVQHMPAHFTESFAQRLNAMGKLKVKEAQEGDILTAGTVFVAAGGKHLIARKSGNDKVLHLKEVEEKDRYIPSVDMTMKSIAGIYGGEALGVILTGMGSDGSEGLKEIKEKGGTILAESEETAVVFGMPRVPIQMGIVDWVLPIHKMAETIIGVCH
ncbi:MAG TPA: chemotaxis response regulator protein-glutamate methylesterase [Nitrospiria bacterium]|nr:chemotaxis response regulator protein-glutamate methylesterase [Nitrospiria bacterium]